MLRRAPGRSVGKSPGRALDFEAFAPHAARGAWLAATVLLVGTAIDLFTLWALQRQNQPQWEFVATTNTIDAFPRIALGIAMLYVGLFCARSESLAAYRVVAALAVLSGIAAGLVTLLMATDYFALSRLAAGQGQVLTMLKSTGVKGFSVGVLYVVLFVGFGALGLRRPRLTRR